MLVQNPRIDLLPDGHPGPRRFKIKTAESGDRRGLIDSLLKSRYGFRGYNQVSLPTDQSVHRFTLVAIEDDETIGTITVAFDGPLGLSAETAFRPEVQALRDQNRRVCEFTKLAIDPTIGTKRVLAALFHVAHIVAHRLRGFDTLLIEVNPRHARYYERMLGCQVLAPERHNPTVNAPAVLLKADFSYIMKQIGEFGGQPERAAGERSLYPFAFTLAEEAAIISRMKARQLALQSRQADGGPATVTPSEFPGSDLIT